MYTIFVRKSRYTTKQKGKKRMKRNWKKALCGILTGFMLANGGTSYGSGADQRGRSTGGSNCSSAGHVFY